MSTNQHQERYRNKNILVVGCGMTGRQMLELMKGWGAHVSYYDDDAAIGLEDYSRIRSVEESAGVRFDFYYKSPGVPWSHPLVERLKESGSACLSEVDLFECLPRKSQTKVIGVTGTNGKSTVVDALQFIFKGLGCDSFLGGNIGRPLLEAYGEAAHDFYVFELSSYQLEESHTFKPDVGVLLNIAPDHLDRYPTVDDYLDAKLNLFRHQEPGQIALIGDTLKGRVSSAAFKSRVCFFGPVKGPESAFYLDAKKNHFCSEVDHTEYPCDVERFKNLLFVLENLVALLAIAVVLKLDVSKVIELLYSYHRLPHRMTSCGVAGGRTLIDDSKATNIHAVQQALEILLRSTRGRIHVLVGGRPKEGGFDAFFESYAAKNIRFYLFGELKDTLLAKMGDRVKRLANVEVGGTMAEALRLAFDRSATGDVIILSPACASFDAFKNYKERGRVFSEEAEKLKRIS